jgi:hypothetical protein
LRFTDRPESAALEICIIIIRNKRQDRANKHTYVAEFPEVYNVNARTGGIRGCNPLATITFIVHVTNNIKLLNPK